MKYKNIQLKDVADIVMGQSPKSVFYNTDGKGIPFLQGVRTFGENYPQIDTWTTSYNRKAKSGEILFSVRAPVGRVNWANQDLAVGRGLATLKIKSGYSKEYLYYLFKKIGSHLNSLATGTVFTSINKKELEALELKIPVNLSDQEKIASYLQKIDQEIELNNQINDNLIQIFLLNLANMIKNKSYEIRKISDLDIIISDHVANGSFKALKENVTYYDENNYALFLRNIDFKNRLDGANRYIDKESYNYLKKSHLFGGEVVISNVADVGTIHRVPFINRPMVIGNNQIFIKSVHSFLTEYLYVYFKSYWGQNSIFSITSGSAQQKFNKTDFRALEIPIPSPNWILTNIRPFILAKDKIFNETKSLEQLKKNLLNNYF